MSNQKPLNNIVIMRSVDLRDDECKSGDLPVLSHDASSTSLKSLLFQGLTLDQSEPWERSLLHTLRDEGLHKPLKPRDQDMMLLQHTESRDQALQIDDDDISFMSSFGVTAPSRRNSIYRHSNAAARETSLFDNVSETFSTASSYKVLRAALLTCTLSSVTSPDDYDETRSDQQDFGRSTIQQRRASDCGSTRSSSSSRRHHHQRRLSAPNLVRTSPINEEEHGAHHLDKNEEEEEENSLIAANSIIAIETEEASVDYFMGNPCWDFRPLQAMLPPQDERREGSEATENRTTGWDGVVQL